MGHHKSWSSFSGFEARIDYVACSRALRHSWTRSWTDTFDMAAPRLDHRYCALHMDFGVTTSRYCPAKNRFEVSADVRGALLAHLSAVGPTAWQVSVDSHFQDPSTEAQTVVCYTSRPCGLGHTQASAPRRRHCSNCGSGQGSPGLSALLEGAFSSAVF